MDADDWVGIMAQDGIIVPESSVLRRERGPKFGAVDLGDEEPASPNEIKRCVMMDMYAPLLLSLPGNCWELADIAESLDPDS